MATLEDFKKSLQTVESADSKASFNVKAPPKPKGLKKLQALKKLEAEKAVEEVLEELEEKKDSLFIDLPKFRTLITPIPPYIPEVVNLTGSRKYTTPSYSRSVNWRIDEDGKVLYVGKGSNVREYFIEALTSGNSRTGKSISKNEAQELANTYFKLKIPPQNKKEVFIEEILKHIGLAK